MMGMQCRAALTVLALCSCGIVAAAKIIPVLQANLVYILAASVTAELVFVFEWVS